ncbi:MAG: hypothetical protein ACRDPO_00900 [Streptosporangiaceae bacterium]
MPGSALSASNGSASAGPSMSTMSGWTRSSSATTDLAEPGPWCRMPSTATRSGPGRARLRPPADPVAAGTVTASRVAV